MYEQIFLCLDSVFPKLQCGFRKAFNAQSSLLTMVEKWRKTLDEGGKTGTFLTDLSKTFGCIDHNLLIGKHDAYGSERRSQILENVILSLVLICQLISAWSLLRSEMWKE